MTDPDTPSDITATLGLDARKRTGRRIRRVILLGGIALLVVLGALYLLRRPEQGGVTYQTEKAASGSLTVTVTATGNLEPINQVDVGSELSGIIRTVQVDYNDRVTEGEVLATLDQTRLQAEVMKSRAALASARAGLQKAQATTREAEAELDRLKRVRVLSRNRMPSENEITTAEAALDRARAEEGIAGAQIAQNEASLYANETDLSKTVIHSPINGIVLSRAIEVGQTVAASLQAPVLFTLAEDLTQMELHVDVDEADVGQVAEGQEAAFTVDAFPERTFPARITQVRYGAVTVDGVVTYETVLSVDNADLSLRPGMTATADIIVRRVEETLLVPNAALRFSPPEVERSRQRRGLVGMLLPRPPRRWTRRPDAAAPKGQRIWVLSKGEPVPVRIRTGATDGSYTEVTGGDLESGSPVITGMSREQP